MKTFCMLAFTIFVAFAFGEDSSHKGFSDFSVKEKNVREAEAETKSTIAYKRAKAACLKSAKGHLQGKNLTECIVNYQKEAK